MQHLIEVAGSRPDLWESTGPGDLQCKRNLEEEPGTAQTGNDGERDKNREVLQPLTLLTTASLQDPGAIFQDFQILMPL